MILGLAASNRTAENILFTARHTLSVCKSLFGLLYNSWKRSDIYYLHRGWGSARRVGERKYRVIFAGHGEKDGLESRTTYTLSDGAVG